MEMSIENHSTTRASSLPGSVIPPYLTRTSASQVPSRTAWNEPPPEYAPPPPPIHSSYNSQQQQQVVVVSMSGPSQAVAAVSVKSYMGHIVLSCFVFWCCNWLFGLIAFILAVIASDHAGGDPDGAASLGKASCGMSIAGMVSSIIVVIIVVSVLVSAAQSVVTTANSYSSSGSSKSCQYYYYNNVCYRSYSYSYTGTTCLTSKNGYYVGSVCYYN